MHCLNCVLDVRQLDILRDTIETRGIESRTEILGKESKLLEATNEEVWQAPSSASEA
jgi:predicted metallo-beta-lactamase superfamily hydrolase